MWFKSKLQHADPDVRRQYIEGLETGDPSLDDVVTGDPHPDVRSAALEKLVDLEILGELGKRDADEAIRRLAIARLQALVAGQAEGSPELEYRMRFMRERSDERMTRFLVRNAQEPELRKAALQSILSGDCGDAQDLLCEIAVSDPVQEIREAAAQPVEDPAHLQRLLEESRGRDKGIHRLARARLDAIEKTAQAQAGLAATAAAADELLSTSFSADGLVEQGTAARLEADWGRHAEAAGGVDLAMQTRFNETIARIRDQVSRLQELQQRREAIIHALKEHLADRPAESVSELIRRWHELPEPSSAMEREFDRLVREVSEHDSRRDRDRQRIAARQELLDEMEAKADTALTADLERFEERWQRGNEPEDAAEAAAQNDRFRVLRERIFHRLEQEAQKLDEQLARAGELLDRYDASLESGSLKEAVSAHDKALSLLNRLDLPEKRKNALMQRLKRNEPKMAELKRWRHWGTDRKREELCEKAEKLTDSDLEIPKVARAVREYREEWKTLDKSDGPAAKKLWTRFDTACEKAYEPCQAYFEKQKDQRKANMARRDEICSRLESLAADTDWEAPPWRDLSEALKQAQLEWHRAGSVDRREKNKIQKRFDAARTSIDEHLDGMRRQEIERREKLIAEVEGFAGSDDMRRAVDRTRVVQKEWKPLVQAGRRKEQQLWKRFRAACDAVFEQRKARFAEADKERKQNLAEKRAVNDQVEGMIASLNEQLEKGAVDAEFLGETQARLRQLESGWRRIGPVPRDQHERIDKAFRASSKKLQALCRRGRLELERQALNAVREASAACETAELAIAAGAEVDVAALGLAIKSLDGDSTNAGLVERLAAARSAVEGDDDAAGNIRAALEGNLATKRRLCLEIEIAAGIESPPDCREERMQYRVAQLSQSLTGNRQRLEPLELERSWYVTGAVPPDEHDGLEERFRRALEALSAS